MVAKTLAMSIVIHGEAVRFNRGKSRPDDFDFKYMRGYDGKVYPYVSSQCFKKYWREALQSQPSPVIRQGRNQAFTLGDPITFVDDDLFGYMVAGADADEESDESEATETTDAVDDVLERVAFQPEVLKQGGKPYLNQLLISESLPDYLRTKLTSDEQEAITNANDEQEAITNAKDKKDKKDKKLTEEVLEILLKSLNEALGDKDLSGDQRFGRTKPSRDQKAKIDSGKTASVASVNRKLLLDFFKREMEQDKPQDTKRRTAAVRMHALVAFSGIRTARDFQTFARDTPYNGEFAVINPNEIGIYSGWMKSRILIEAHRIGKFYVGKNLDILPDQTKGSTIEKKTNPYSRKAEDVSFVRLPEQDRTSRLQAIVQALADVGNRQGPASGALHDGSLRPKAFIAAMMTCADSPFDSVWIGSNDRPHLDTDRLKNVLSDWGDLFLDKRIYVGLFVDGERSDKTRVEKVISEAGFQPIVGLPRTILLQLAKEVAA